MTSTRLLRCGLPLAALFALIVAAPIAAQDDDEDQKRKPGAAPEDPYTKGEEAAIAEAGYVSLGPFVFGDNHTTLDVDHVLGVKGGVLWIETEHFKIGCSRAAYTVRRGDRKEKTRIKAELKRLSKRLPKIKTSTSKLDRWLRAHLFAQRAEELYDRFCELAGVTDESFPSGEGAGEIPKDAKYMGLGPYLGHREKFTILLLEKQGTLGQYASTFLNMPEADHVVRHNFFKTGGLFFGSSIDHAEGDFTSDTAQHCELAFSLGSTFVDAFKYFGYRLPSWIPEGIGHYMSREIDPRFVLLGADVIYNNDPSRYWDWEPRVYGRVKFGTYPKAEELLAHRGELSPIDEIMAWSRIEFLASDPDKFAVFLDVVKSIPFAGATPTPEVIHELQIRALKEAYGFDLAEFDEKWAAHVLSTYSKKRSKNR